MYSVKCIEIPKVFATSQAMKSARYFIDKDDSKKLLTYTTLIRKVKHATIVLVAVVISKVICCYGCDPRSLL
jgi:hypothetical protein